MNTIEELVDTVKLQLEQAANIRRKARNKRKAAKRKARK